MDLYFFVNGLLDALLLYLTGRITDQKISPLRVAAGALWGAVGATWWFCLRAGHKGKVLDFLIMLAVAVGMDIISWGRTSPAKWGVRLGWLFGMSVLLAGITQVCGNWLRGGLSPIALFLLTTLMCLGGGSGISVYYRISGRREHVAQVRCRMGDTWITFYGWLDSGNLLRDPISQKPVMIVEERLLESVGLPEAVPIPYRTIDTQGRILWGYYPDEVWLRIKNRERRADWVIASVSYPIRIHGCRAIVPVDCSGEEKE